MFWTDMASAIKCGSMMSNIRAIGNSWGNELIVTDWSASFNPLIMKDHDFIYTHKSI